MKVDKRIEIGEYDDNIHAEVLENLQAGDYGYKYRIVDGVVMPPYITPSRYELSRTIRTQIGDICYTSYPKSGSTWLAYILVLIVGNGEIPSDPTLRSGLHWVENSWTYPRSRMELDALAPPETHVPYALSHGAGRESRAKPLQVYLYSSKSQGRRRILLLFRKGQVMGWTLFRTLGALAEDVHGRNSAKRRLVRACPELVESQQREEHTVPEVRRSEKKFSAKSSGE